MEQSKSLYEYLGHAAGSKLGIEVAAAARAEGIIATTQVVSNPTYSGVIYVYPVSFLNRYFHPTIELTAKDTQNNNLPF